MNSTLPKTPWRDLKFIEKFNHFQEIPHQIELGTDVGQLVNLGVFIETLVYAEIN